MNKYNKSVKVLLYLYSFSYTHSNKTHLRTGQTIFIFLYKHPSKSAVFVTEEDRTIETEEYNKALNAFIVVPPWLIWAYSQTFGPTAMSEPECIVDNSSRTAG